MVLNFPLVGDHCDKRFIFDPDILGLKCRDDRYCLIHSISPTTNLSIIMDTSDKIYFTADGALFATLHGDMSSLNIVPPLPAKFDDQSYGLMLPYPQFPCLTTISGTIKFELEDHIYIWQMEDGLVGALSLAGQLWPNKTSAALEEPETGGV